MLDRYRELLSTPGAAAFAFAGLLSRFPISMFNLGLILLVQIQYDDYALAGAVAAVGVVVWALQTVPTARLVDRYGQSRAMWPLIGLHVTGATLAIVTAMAHGHVAWLCLAAALASLSGPLGSLTRARWSHILRRDRDIHAAFSLEGAFDEILFIGGPALVAVLCTAVWPPLGLIVSTTATLVGLTILLSQTSTEPPRRAADSRGLGWRVPRPVLAVTAIGLAMGAIFGAFDISVVAFAEESGVKAWAGVILAVFSLGSFFGGLWYGSREWRAPLWRRTVTASCLAALGFAIVVLMPNVYAFAAFGFFAGSTVAPIFASSDNAVQRSVRRDQLTEGMAWIRIGIGIGVAIGAWIAGHLIESDGARAGLYASGAAALAVAVVALAAIPWLRLTPEGEDREPDPGAVVPATPLPLPPTP